MSSITTELKTVGTAAVRLARVDDVASAGKDGRVTYEIHNGSGSTVYMGGPAVTVENGMPLPAGASRTLALPLYGEAYGIAAEEGLTVRVMKVP